MLSVRLELDTVSFPTPKISNVFLLFLKLKINFK